MIYVFLALITDISAFPSGDASYYNLGGRYIYGSVESGLSLIESIEKFNWDKKYWGYLFLNYVSVLAFPEDIFLQSLLLVVISFLLWLTVIAHASKKVFVSRDPDLYITFFLFLAPVFPIFLNYRDIYIASILYFLIYSVYFSKNIRFTIFLSGLLLLFRDEFVTVVFAAITFSFITARYLSSRRVLVFSLCFAIAVVIVCLNKHQALDISRVVKIPLSFIGTSTFNIVADYVVGQSYYQGRIFNHISLVVFSFVWLYFTYLILITVFENSTSSEDAEILYFIYFFFVFNMVAYTLINDGFQERVRVAFIPFAIFLFKLVKKDSKSYSLMFFIGLSFLMVTLRNLRWVF